jgi:hypothetical protein
MTNSGERILTICETLPDQARDVLRMYGRAVQLGAQIGVALAVLIIGAFIPSPTAAKCHETPSARFAVRTQAQKVSR